SGGVVAKRLAEAGLSILCLEQGGWPDRSEYPGATPEWELLAAKQWSSVPHSAHWPRMLPADFAVRTRDGVAADWPIGYDDLQPYYETTDRDFGVSGLGGNPMYPPGADPPMPPLPIGGAGL